LKGTGARQLQGKESKKVGEMGTTEKEKRN